MVILYTIAHLTFQIFHSRLIINKETSRQNIPPLQKIHKSRTPTNSPTPITEDDLGVQYFPAYVVRKFSKKCSESLKILNEMKANDYSGQELIAAQSRGPLQHKVYLLKPR